ncbi:MAG: hypothetical protein K2M55_03995 [Muribaculaceae bacterium]|nr:hypothetical protein [Muribaculaceae bacterium]
MKKLDNHFTIKGKSGREYKFNMYSIDCFEDVKGVFNDVSAVYIFTRRYKQQNGSFSHTLIYCGETEHLNRRFYDHDHENDINVHNANCFCVMGVSNAERENIEADILEGNDFTCNTQHNC